MKKIALLAAKDIGLECFKHILKFKKECFIDCVLTNSEKESNKRIVSLANENNIEVLDNLDILVERDIDILISIQYHEILKERHINSAKDISVNLHMAPLPEYRGCNQFSFAIIDGVNKFGTTIHRMLPGVDNGPIIFEDRFEIPKKDQIDVNQLYEITYEKSLELFATNFEKLISGSYEELSQEQLIAERGTSFHLRSEINDIKVIDKSWPDEKIVKHIRATNFKGFEPPYMLVEKKKIYLSLEE